MMNYQGRKGVQGPPGPGGQSGPKGARGVDGNSGANGDPGQNVGFSCRIQFILSYYRENQDLQDLKVTREFKDYKVILAKMDLLVIKEHEENL